MTPADDSELISCKDAAKHLKVRLNTFYLMVKEKRGPPVIRIGNRMLRIEKADFFKWLEDQKLCSR